MSFFKKKEKGLPLIEEGRFDPVLRCSICSGEQVLCAKDCRTGELHELMLIKSRAELEDVCEANGIDVDSVQKIY